MPDRRREIIDTHVLGNDLTEPLVPVVPKAAGSVDLQILRPQHFQRGLVPPQPRRDDFVDIDRHELARDALAPVGEQPIDVFARERIDLADIRQLVFVKHPADLRDRALRAPCRAAISRYGTLSNTSRINWR